MTDAPSLDDTPFEVTVLENGSEATWSLHAHRNPDRQIELTLHFTADQTWTTRGTDFFGLLMSLRELVEPSGILICCNGARINAWSSGMQRDMGVGHMVYLLEEGERSSRPQMLPTWGPVNSADVVTLSEQSTWHQASLSQEPETSG